MEYIEVESYSGKYEIGDVVTIHEDASMMQDIDGVGYVQEMMDDMIGEPFIIREKGLHDDSYTLNKMDGTKVEAFLFAEYWLTPIHQPKSESEAFELYVERKITQQQYEDYVKELKSK